MESDTHMEPDSVSDGAESTNFNYPPEVFIKNEVPDDPEDSEDDADSEDSEDSIVSCLKLLADFRRRVRIKDKLEAVIARKALRRSGIFEQHMSLYPDEFDIIKRNFKWVNGFIKQNFYDDYQETLEDLNRDLNRGIVRVKDEIPTEIENSNDVNSNFNESSENIITIEDDDDEDDSPPVHEEKPNVSNLSWIKMENVEVKKEWKKETKPSSSENFCLPGPSGTNREQNPNIQNINLVQGTNEFIYARFENLISGEEILNIPEPSAFCGRSDLFEMLHSILTTGISRCKKNKKRNVEEVTPTPGPSGSQDKRSRNIIPQNLTEESDNLTGENITEITAIYESNIGYWIPKAVFGHLVENNTGPSIEFHTDIDPVCNEDRKYVGYKMFAFVGDQNGHIGFSATYSENYSAALQYNKQQALLNMIRIKRYAYKAESQILHTIAFQVYGKSGDIKVIIMPGYPEWGIGTYHLDVSEAIRLAGIDDCKVVVEGYTRAIDDVENIAKATFSALKKLIDVDHTSASF